MKTTEHSGPVALAAAVIERALKDASDGDRDARQWLLHEAAASLWGQLAPTVLAQAKHELGYVDDEALQGAAPNPFAGLPVMA